MSEEATQVYDEVSVAGGQPSRLDFILREPKQGSHRFAWSQIEVKDGWLEMKQLPDMAMQHLAAADAMLQVSESEPNSPHASVAAVMLSICAAEAFINQVAFFLHEVQGFHEAKLHNIPEELKEDPLEFQRRTELTIKWQILGKALCGSNWPSKKWNDFKSLLYLRNELVHFKANEYEQIVPPPTNPHPVLARLPQTIEIRSTTQAWPQRVLTPSLARWAVDVVTALISDFRKGYRANRINSSSKD